MRRAFVHALAYVLPATVSGRPGAVTLLTPLHFPAMTHSRTCLALLPCLGLLLACDPETSPEIPGNTDDPGTGGEGLLIDDFEDGDVDNQLGVSWHFYSDQDADGASTITTEPNLGAVGGRRLGARPGTTPPLR